jgi:prepilin-type N-terminal cleavage/methylation domain-containing protein
MELIRPPKVKMKATTLATGRAGASATGFTLVELLVVIAILSMLFGLVVATVGQVMGRGYQASTVALILRIQDWMDEYRSLTGHYPLDGLDSRVEDEAGFPLRGSAALQYELSRNVIVEEIFGTRRRLREVPPIGKFESGELSGGEDPDYPGVKEIIDGWGTPLHYDNTENGRFRPQDGSVHYPPVPNDQHPDDPREGNREVEGKPVVERPGNQGRGADLWSHGEHGHDPLLLPNVPIASWNATRFK